MGNRNSSGRAAGLLTSCCKCRTYSVDSPDGGRANDAGAAGPVELNERQPVAPGREEPVDNQPSSENTHENQPGSAESPTMSRLPRLPRPPRIPVGKPSFSLCVIFSSSVNGALEVNCNSLVFAITLRFIKQQLFADFEGRNEKLVILLECIKVATRANVIFGPLSNFINIGSVRI